MKLFLAFLFITLSTITSAETTADSITASSTPQTPPEKIKDDSIIASAGIGFRNTTWKHIEDASNTTMKFDIDTAQYTLVEGDLTIPKIAVKLGINVYQDSNELSKVKEFAGYLGFSRMTLRTESGKFKGKAHFSGLLGSGQQRDLVFDQTFRFMQIDIWPSDEIPFFIGLRHTTWKLPTEIALIYPGKTSGPTVLDPDFETSFYSLLGGFDFFKHNAIKTKNYSPGWSALFNMAVGMGYGKSHIGDSAARSAKENFNKTLTETDPSVMVLHTSGQLGPAYNFQIKDFRLALGVGYDWNLLMLINTSKKASSSTEAQPVAYPNFVYHGFIVRAYGSF